jgi:hypothetical protein
VGWVAVSCHTLLRHGRRAAAKRDRWTPAAADPRPLLRPETRVEHNDAFRFLKPLPRTHWPSLACDPDQPCRPALARKRHHYVVARAVWVSLSARDRGRQTFAQPIPRLCKVCAFKRTNHRPVESNQKENDRATSYESLFSTKT